MSSEGNILSFDFKIQPMAPYRLDLTVWAIRRRPINIMDRWKEKTYFRTIEVDDRVLEIAVSQDPDHRLKVRVIGAPFSEKTKAGTIAFLQRVLGTKRDLTPFYSLAAKDRNLRVLSKIFLGLKPPQFPSIFEALLNGISCQQLSLTVGLILLNRLTEKAGKSLPQGTGSGKAFPSPENLSLLSERELRAMGYSRQKAGAIRNLTESVLDGRIDLEGLQGLDNRKVMERLLELKGVGRWTAEYVLLRGLGRLEIFPGDDLGARKKIKEWLHLSQSPSYQDMEALVRPWQPFAGLVYFHLLLSGLAGKGFIPGI